MTTRTFSSSRLAIHPCTVRATVSLEHDLVRVQFCLYLFWTVSKQASNVKNMNVGVSNLALLASLASVEAFLNDGLDHKDVQPDGGRVVSQQDIAFLVDLTWIATDHVSAPHTLLYDLVTVQSTGTLWPVLPLSRMN